MYGWCIAVGLTAAGLALAYARHRRRRAERARIDRCRATVDELSLSAPDQLDGTGSSNPPTEDHLSRTASPRQAAPAGCAVQRRRRVVLSASDLSTTLAPILGPRGRLL